MPIFFEGKAVGALNITSLQKNAFNEDEIKLLEIVSQQVGTAINNAQKAEALRKAQAELAHVSRVVTLFRCLLYDQVSRVGNGAGHQPLDCRGPR
jgi:GAF domain-containing protein